MGIIMQPKTPKPTYSIILMRDDCNVSAFRLHSFWFRFFILFLIILMGLCAAGAYGAFYYKNLYVAAAAERRELQRSLGENRIKLENLVNEELVGRFTGTGPGAPSTGRAQDGQAPSGGSIALSDGAQAPGTATPTPEDLARLLDQTGPVRAAGSDSPEPAPPAMEDHPVKVSNLKVTFEGEDRIRFNYDLSNQRPGVTLVGRCSLALVTREGAIIDITPSARGVLSFQIARFRKMDIVAQIPPSLKRSDILRVQISAKANDFPVYSRQFPLE